MSTNYHLPTLAEINALLDEDEEHETVRGWLKVVLESTPLEETAMMDLCDRVKDILTDENTLVRVPAPATVVGDIHGQFFDLLHLFELVGEPKNMNYVFLGDYVDRGHFSLATIAYLFILKIQYPDQMTLIRGNHEARSVSQVYGFYDECISFYGDGNIWRNCCEVFDLLPLAAVVDDRVLCVHGGLSPDINTLDEIQQIFRLQDIPKFGPMCDIVWSDPEECGISDWAPNPRGCGWLFGEHPCKQFNLQNGLGFITRAHQLVMEGFSYIFDNELVTIWSAPNYCYKCGNSASVLNIGSDGSEEVQIFDASPVQGKTPAWRKVENHYFL